MKREMSPRERILATINREKTDRIPIDVWCTPEVLDMLHSYTGKKNELDVYTELGLDKIVWIFPGYGEGYFDPNDSGDITMWGVPTRKVRAGKATYQEYLNPPLASYDDPSKLNGYALWPDPDKFDYKGAKKLALAARAHDFATIGPWVSHFEIYCQMRGLENAMMDTLLNPDFLDETLDRIEAIQTVMMDRLLTELDKEIDMVFISDDMGMQTNLLIAEESWEQFIRPRLKRWCDLIHEHGKKVFYHTDGSVLPLIPGLIDCGIDILNPIQHVCPGMETAGLKEKFGDKVIFHGGVENQRILPMGTVDEVIEETKECLETLGKDGGYICCSCHNMQAGTPLENVLAMIDTVKKFG